MTGRPAAAGRSLQRSGCQTEPWATSSAEVPPPPVPLGEEAHTDGCVSGALGVLDGETSKEQQNRLLEVTPTQLGFTPSSVWPHCLWSRLRGGPRNSEKILNSQAVPTAPPQPTLVHTQRPLQQSPRHSRTGRTCPVAAEEGQRLQAKQKALGAGSRVLRRALL